MKDKNMQEAYGDDDPVFPDNTHHKENNNIAEAYFHKDISKSETIVFVERTVSTNGIDDLYKSVGRGESWCDGWENMSAAITKAKQVWKDFDPEHCIPRINITLFKLVKEGDNWKRIYINLPIDLEQ